MFHLTQNTGKGRRASRSGKAQRISSTTWIGMVLAFLSLFRLLLVLSLVLGGSVATQTQQQYEDIIVEFSSRECPNKEDWEFSSIEIDGNKVSAMKGGQRFINLTPGNHVVSALREPDYPNAKLVAVRVKLGSKLIKEYPVDASGSVTITMDASLFNVAGARAQIIPVSENDCGDKPTTKKEELGDKKAYVILRSLECEKDNYDDYSINIDGRIIKTNTLEAAYDVPINPGESEISISVPGYFGAKIKDVAILTPRPHMKRDSSFLADDSGRVKVTLKESLWPEASDDPFIILHTVGDCSPTYNPPAQGPFGQPRIKVATVKGIVQVFKDDNPNYDARVQADSMIEDQQVIYTSPGARIELVASDKRLFILGEKTVVKISIKTLEGLNMENIEELKNKTNVKWELNVNARTGSIETSHVGHLIDPYELEILTPTAAVTEKQTIYSVTYNESDKVTTVGVEQGQVTVTPTNPSLNPVNLDDYQMVEVFQDRVSSISPYTPQRLSPAKETGGLFNRPLLLVGIGAAALVGLLIVVAGITFLSRRVKHAPVQTAYHQTGIKVEAAPAKFAAPAVATNEWRCPNPQCGKLVPASKKFCTACGTRSGFKVEARPAYVAAPAVASRERRCPNTQCGKLVPASKKFCTACGTRVI